MDKQVDALGQVLEALQSRIKAPYFGYIFLAFVAFNWEALFYLFFSGSPAIGKLQYFNGHSDRYHLIVYPLFVGLAATFAAPWLTWFFVWLGQKPTTFSKKTNKAIQYQVDQATLMLEQQSELDGKIEELKKQGLIIENLSKDIEVKNGQLLVKNAEVESLQIKEKSTIEKINGFANIQKKLQEALVEEKNTNTKINGDVNKLNTQRDYLLNLLATEYQTVTKIRDVDRFVSKLPVDELAEIDKLIMERIKSIEAELTSDFDIAFDSAAKEKGK